MLRLFKKFFAVRPPDDFAQLVKDGAVVLDVRTQREYSSGHVKGAINISIAHLESSLHSLPNKLKPVITCCASGARSASAKRILEAHGYRNVYNGGSWTELNNQLK